METPEAKHKTQKPKSQISCYNGTINIIKPLALGPQNFDHTSMVTPEAKLKTQNPNLKFNPKPKFQNSKP